MPRFTPHLIQFRISGANPLNTLSKWSDPKLGKCPIYEGKRLCYGRPMDPYDRPMDRGLILSYLRVAEEHVANDVQDIADQRDLISTLERTGHNATSAIARLREMEKAQVRHVADRERLRAELAVLNAAEVGPDG